MIQTNAPAIGGNDRLITGTGADVVFGGAGLDYVDSGSEAAGDISRDIVLGDNGRAQFGATGFLELIFTSESAIGGDDTILIGGGNNVAFGGVGNDLITAGNGDDVIVGDNGSATFDATTHHLVDVHSTNPADAGTDTIDASNGNNVVLGGTAIDTITTGSGDDVVVGDNGSATFYVTGVLQSIETRDPSFGGDDQIAAGTGADVVFGGSGHDAIDSGSIAAGDVSRDVVVGDNGHADFDASGNLVLVYTTVPATGGNDTILIGGGNNVAFGGVGEDLITAGDGHDAIAGDNGSALFDATTHALIDMHTTDAANAGVDVINAANGDNVIFGGTANDTINTGNGSDVVVGDNGAATFYNDGVLHTIDTSFPDNGGDDIIKTDTGADVVFGGSGNDEIDTGSVASGDVSRDVVVGDNGHADFDASGHLVLVYTTVPATGGNDAILIGGGNNVAFGGVGEDFITAGDGHDVIAGDNGSALFDATTHALIDMHTTDAANAGVDVINAANGDNVVFGGTANDTINTGNGSDVIVGDNGIATFYANGILRNIETSDPAHGGNDGIAAGIGADVVFGGSGKDTIDSGSVAAGDVSRDVVVGDNGHADFDVAGNLALIFTTVPAAGDDDTILIGGGDNVAFGGVGNDTLTAGDGHDIIVGDNGSAEFFSGPGHAAINVHTTDPTHAGTDTIVAANGNNIVFGGTAVDTITTGTGADVVVGDNGIATFYNDGVLHTIDTSFPDNGGDDIIKTDTGPDVVFGGSGNDEIDSGSVAAGDLSRDVVVGDNGHADFDASGHLALIYTTVPATGGNDTILIGGGNNVAFGGVGNDTITAGDGDDIIVGDNGSATFDAVTHAVIDAHTTDPVDAGLDLINAANGNNVILGGSANDTINTGNGSDIVVGDNGRALFDATAILRVIETIDPTFTGEDLINTGTGPDVVLGGNGSDNIDTGSVAAGDVSRDVVAGDNGRAEFDAAGHLTFVTTTDPSIGGLDTILIGGGDNVALGGVADDSITAGDGSDVIVGDNGAATFHATTHTLANIHTSDALHGGVDTILAGNGNNVVLGGSAVDTITTGTGDDIVLGDNGVVDTVIADANPADIDLIASTDFDIGGVDTISTSEGSDIVIGGQGADIIDAATGNNIVFGDSARIVSAIADATNFSTQPLTLGRLETLAPGIGGADVIKTGIDRDIIVGGTAGDTITANIDETATVSDGDNIVLGDDGYIDFVRGEREPTAVGGDVNPADMDVIASSDFADGAADTITTGNGSDIIIGGQAGDTILAGHGSNLVIGDSGIITAATEDENRFSSQPMTVGRVETTAFGIGGADSVTTGSGNDLVLGGHDGDTIIAGDGDNVVAGDDAAIDYVHQERDGSTPGADLNAADIDLVTSLSTTAAGGIDTITTGIGNDIVLGGRLGDNVNAGTGSNIVLGDSGRIIAANEDTARFGSAPTNLLTAGRIETITPGDGGNDTLTTGLGLDIVLGGTGADTIVTNQGETSTTSDADNIVFGDDGYLDFVRAERESTELGGDTNAADIDVIASIDFADGASDSITTGNGSDIVLGGQAGDTIAVGQGTNIVIGDSGVITAATEDLNRFASQPITVGRVETTAFGIGGADSITSGAGNDLVLGGHDGDTINAGNGDNVVTGDDAAIDYVRQERAGATPGADLNAADIDIVTSLSTTAAGGSDQITTGVGNDIVIGGRFGDNVNAGTGSNIVLGDSGRIIAANEDTARFGSAPTNLLTAGRIETIEPGDGGNDTLTTGLGRDIILGGTGADTIVANQGESGATSDTDNIVLGDDGYLDFVRAEREPGALGGDTNAADIDVISSIDFADGAADSITTGNGSDIVIGGQAGDTILAGHGTNIVIGDSGIITAATEDLNRFASEPITVGLVETTAFGIGGADNITTGFGNDLVLGGHDNDTINASDGDNVVAGDDAAIDYVRAERDGVTPGADFSAADIDLVVSLSTAFAGGVDNIVTGVGNDIAFGGRFGDTINAGTGSNIVLGDSGRIIAANADDARFGSAPTNLLTIGRIETTEPGDGGNDTLTTGVGRDIIFGGTAADTIVANEGETTATADADNIVLGDDGYIDFTRAEREPTALGGDTDATDIDVIASTDFADGARDVITTGNGSDLIVAGQANDSVNASNGSNVVIGDSGIITAATENVNRFATQPIAMGRIESTAFGIGGADDITTGVGNDFILGGHDNDTINAGNGDNVVAGDDAALDYTRQEREGVTPGADLNAADIDLITSLSTTAAGGVDNILTGTGNDIVVGGRFGDTIDAQGGKNIVIGDSGEITAANQDANRFGTQAITVGLIVTNTFGDGGADTIVTLAGVDVILGGHDGDTINAGDGDNVVLGDDGLLDYVRLERSAATSGADIDASDIDLILSTSTAAAGGVDTITTGAGNDIVIGGRYGDTIVTGNGNNIAVGDSAQITAVDENTPRFGTQAMTVGRVETIELSDGGADTIRTGVGEDVIFGGAIGDRLDAGAGNDLIAGDNAVVDRTGRVGNFTNFLFEALTGALIYDMYGNVLVNDVAANQPGGAPVWGDMTLTLIDHSFAEEATVGSTRFGNDYIAGGAGNDRIFGELGDDTIQGDGSIDLAVSARRLADGTLEVFGSVEAATDGDDYIEGNGGNDLVFGGLGQDDIIGGSSALFGLTDRLLRPDGSDLLFGGAGTDLAREDAGDTTTTGRARDADTIVGDNANVFRLVGTNGVAGNYLTFSYDNYGALKLIPRAVELLDYTPGGIDLSANAANDIGAADEVHGESGNDSIYGQLGNDVLFGEGQDDDIIGGTGADWIASGNGEDGVIGDDGRLYTSRNGTAETLYGIAAIPDGGLNDVISTPGNMQNATINISGALKKTAIVEPFMLTDIETVAGVTPSNDIIFGGLGNDAIHGGAGDDAISGAEALPGYYAKPFNPGDYLRWSQAGRPGEFAAYDEYNPRTKIYVNSVTFEFTNANAAGAVEFLLNFVATEQDGNDVLFGDVGNDWIVGGMGRDHLYGGYGDDLLNADDNHETGGGLNNTPDGPDANQEDLAYGGAGRDILIANTAGDRLIDWAGEFNSYLVPFAAFGSATVSRTLQPQLAEFLYDLSYSDGADTTRALKTGSSAARNGEPEGELGMVRQQDFDWGDQTGAPDDPQPGNIPGGKRDVKRSADFNNGSADGFVPDSGTWQVIGGRFQVEPTSTTGDAVSVFYVDSLLPRYFEMRATINAVKPTGGYKANAYLIFDYQSPTDFKFAGIDVSTNKLVIGHRTASGWVVDATKNMQLKAGQDYNVLLAVNGVTATIVVDNSSANVLSFAFTPRVIEGYSYDLNTGMVGLGANGARAQIDNVAVQTLPPTITFQDDETFADGTANLLTGAQNGQWAVTASRDIATIGAGGFASSNFEFTLSANALLQFDTTVKIGAAGTSAGVVFDYYDAQNFKFAAIVAGTNQVVIGHYVKNTWVIDATATRPVAVNTDYAISLSLKGTTASVSVDGQAAVGFVFNAVIVDGQAGLFTRTGTASFASYSVKTDDPQFAALPSSTLLPAPVVASSATIQTKPSTKKG